MTRNNDIKLINDTCELPSEFMKYYRSINFAFRLSLARSLAYMQSHSQSGIYSSSYSCMVSAESHLLSV